MGRIGSSFWGGYWCGRWHLGRPGGAVGTAMSPGYTSGDALRGWDHLAWHHLAFVFAGDTVLVPRPDPAASRRRRRRRRRRRNRRGRGRRPRRRRRRRRNASP